MDNRWLIAIAIAIILIVVLIIWWMMSSKKTVVVVPPPVSTIPADIPVGAGAPADTPAPPPTPCDYDLVIGIRAGGGRLVSEPATECNDDPTCLGYDTVRGYVFSGGDYYYEPDWKSGAVAADGKPVGTYFKRSPGCRWAQIPTVPFTPECGWVRYDSMGISAPTIEEMPATDMVAVRARCNELSNCVGYSVPGGAKVQLKGPPATTSNPTAGMNSLAIGPDSLEPMNGYSFIKQNPNCIGGTSLAGIAGTGNVSAEAACDFMNVSALTGDPIAITNSLSAAKLLCSQSATCGGLSQRDALFVLYPIQDSPMENKFSGATILAKRDQTCVRQPLIGAMPAGPPPAQYVFVPMEVPAASASKSLARIDARAACDADPQCVGYTYDNTLTSGLYIGGTSNPLMERVAKPTMTSAEGTYIKILDTLPTCGYTNYAGQPAGQTIADVTADPRGACDADPTCKAYTTYFDTRQGKYTIQRLKSGIANLDTTAARTYAKNNAACVRA